MAQGRARGVEAAAGGTHPAAAVWLEGKLITLGINPTNYGMDWDFPGGLVGGPKWVKLRSSSYMP